jgi:biotin carboxylase
MVLGGGNDQIAVCDALRVRGFRRVLVDYLPSPPAQSRADVHHQESALDADAVLRIATAENATFLVSAGNDPAIRVIAEVSGKLGLPCLVDLAMCSRGVDKEQMKARFAAAGILTAPYRIVADSTQLGTWSQSDLPAVVKPRFGFGSRGVSMVRTQADCDAAVAALLGDGVSRGAIVEAAVAGAECSVDCFSRGGVAKVLLYSELVKLPDRVGEASFLAVKAWPGWLEGRGDEVAKLATSIGEAFGIENGPWFFQAIDGKDGLIVLEIGLRTAGGHKPDLIQVATGVDVIGATIDLLAGNGPEIVPGRRAAAASMDYLYASPGTIAEVTGLAEAARVQGAGAVRLLKSADARCTGSLGARDRVVAISASADDPSTLADRRRAMVSALAVRSTTGSNLIRLDLFDAALGYAAPRSGHAEQLRLCGHDNEVTAWPSASKGPTDGR